MILIFNVLLILVCGYSWSYFVVRSKRGWDLRIIFFLIGITLDIVIFLIIYDYKKIIIAPYWLQIVCVHFISAIIAVFSGNLVINFISHGKIGSIKENNSNEESSLLRQIKEPQNPATGDLDSVYRQNAISLPDTLIISDIVCNKAIMGAASSLLLWGIINLGAWFAFRENMISMFEKIEAPVGTFDVLIYGSVLIGACMLFFGVFGLITKAKITGWLDGISLICVGTWYALYEFLLIDAIRPYGYQVEHTTALWIVLGIAQFIWGFKQIIRFVNIGYRPFGISEKERAEAKKMLLKIVQEPESPSTGRLKFAIITGSSFPIYTTKTEVFTMWLLPSKAYCLESKLRSSFEIERDHLMLKEFKGIIEVTDMKGDEKSISLSNEARVVFNQWLNPGRKSLIDEMGEKIESSTEPMLGDPIPRVNLIINKEKNIKCSNCHRPLHLDDNDIKSKYYKCPGCKSETYFQPIFNE